MNSFEQQPKAYRSRRRLFTKPDFIKLWLGQFSTYLGSQAAVVALPLTAIIALKASAFEVGLVNALTRLPYILLVLVAGVWVERASKRWLLIVVALLLCVLYVIVPVAERYFELTMALIYTVALISGILIVLIDLAYLVLLPSVVGKHRLAQAQTFIEVSQSAGQVFGPTVSGFLAQVFSASLSLCCSSAAYLIGAITLLFMKTDTKQMKTERSCGIVGEIKEGIKAVFQQPVLRAVTLCTATTVFFYTAYFTLFLLFLVNIFGYKSWLIGVVLGGGALGGMAGAMCAPWICRQVGVGSSMIVALLVGGGGALLAITATGFGASYVLVGIILSHAIFWFGQQIYNVHQVPVRFLLAPPRLYARVNATIRFVVWGFAPMGALVGGLLGEAFGVASGMVISAIGFAGACLWIGLSKARYIETPTGGDALGVGKTLCLVRADNPGRTQRGEEGLNRVKSYAAKPRPSMLSLLEEDYRRFCTYADFQTSTLDIGTSQFFRSKTKLLNSRDQDSNEHGGRHVGILGAKKNTYDLLSVTAQSDRGWVIYITLLNLEGPTSFDSIINPPARNIATTTYKFLSINIASSDRGFETPKILVFPYEKNFWPLVPIYPASPRASIYQNLHFLHYNGVRYSSILNSNHQGLGRYHMPTSPVQPQSTHAHSELVPHSFEIERQDHSNLKGHRSLLLWFTGMSGAGKSSIANKVQANLHKDGLHTCLLDGDLLRQGLNSDLGFAEAHRKENIRRTAEVGKLMVDAGVITLICLISPYEQERRMAKALFCPDDFIEIFVDAPLHILERRDPKGLYAKARKGLIKNFTGIDSPYERPVSPHIVIDSATSSIDHAVHTIREFLQSRQV